MRALGVCFALVCSLFWLSWGWSAEVRVEQLRLLAVAGDLPSQLLMGMRYLQGEELPRNAGKAYFWFALAAERGDAQAQRQFGLIRWLGLGGEPEQQQGLQLLARAAGQGELGGQIIHSLLREEAPAEREQESAEIIQAAAAYNKGVALQQGLGMPPKRREAVQWLRQAAEWGHGPAQYQLGVLYYQGQDVAAEWPRALFWLRQAAEQGDAIAQHNLGILYYQGQGVAENRVQALAWFRRAAESGYAVAQYNLGLFYLAAEESMLRRQEAIYWLHQAAEQGHGEAQLALAVGCANEAQWERALPSCRWLAIAAQRGDKKAVRSWQQLAERFSAEQVAALQQQAQQWHPRAPELLWLSFRR
ncbi:SEL1-like repeat protein [Candidatus Magnetaquicoccus inordinatus]|uniref:SEL1-like repeat protein n=1 Tax=Candidatus Magnetaquicoccus inordinatus TaxID=2496818 RepID=UPI00187D32FF|nr:tetratricopeptide repeat protein [Candidatus Magnetaquicoccus inordinatus]